MEGSTVFPAPTSPTEREDPCEVDVTNVAMHSVTLLTCLCGLAGNGAVLWLLRFHIRRNHITIEILFLAIADFLFLLMVVPATLLFLLEDVSCYNIMTLSHVALLFLLSLLPYFTALYVLPAISIQRCRSILCPLWRRCRCPQGLPRVLVTALNCANGIAFTAVSAMVLSLCLFHEQGHCRGALTSMYALSLFLFAPSVLISRTILLIQVERGSQQQQRKRLDGVILLTVLFTFSPSLCNFLQQQGYTLVSSQVAFLLTCIHSSIKPFIYFSVGSSCRPCSMESLRKSLQRVFEEPEENIPSNNDAAMDTAV